jgi:hypothetical protein
MCDHVIGSGVLYYEEYLGGRLYALTAAHNLYEDGDLFGVLRKSIYVEVYSYTHQCYEPITIRNLSDSVACSPKKNADFAIMVKSEQAHPLGDGENHSLEAKNDRNRADKTEHIRSKVANPS